MILVTLGTQEKQFNRLADAMVEYARMHPKEEIVIQAGHTKCESDSCQVFDYIPKEKMKEYQTKASLIITHGGVGSILEAVQLKKTVIAVPRLKKYHEHLNDHQLQVVAQFTNDGYILGCFDVKDLDKCIKKAKTFHPKPFVSNQKHFLTCIKDEIETLLK